MDGSLSALQQNLGDVMQSVVAELQEVKQQLAELKDEVKVVKRSSAGSGMEQLKQNVAETNSVVKLLAADFNTTRTMMMSEFRSILHAIPRGDEDLLQEQLIAADEALQQARQDQTESLLHVEALLKELSDTKSSLQQAEADVLAGNNSQNELQRELQATKEDVMTAKKECYRLKGELVKAKSESSSQREPLQKQLSGTNTDIQRERKELSEGNNRQKKLEVTLQAGNEMVSQARAEVKNLEDELVKATDESSILVEAPQKELSDMEVAFQQAESQIMDGSNSLKELPMDSQAAKEEVTEADVTRQESQRKARKSKKAKKKSKKEAKSQSSCTGLSENEDSKMKNQSAPIFPSGGKRQSEEMKVTLRPSTSTEEKLVRSENAWKPESFKKKNDESQNEDAELLWTFKSILNKLTPQNFQKLMNQTMQLAINSEERLKGVIDLVFEKAIMEPGFSQAYANMCRVMQSIEVKKADGEPVQFRKLIFIKCQKLFEKNRNEEKGEKEKQRIMAITNEKEREEAFADFEYQQMKVKKQIIGNIRFIGELFKLQMLTERIMQNFIFSLLKAKDEESLECMCKLVTTVGQSLDHVKGKALMDQYFNQVDKIIKEKKVSSRICFMLQDLKDLRENNWKPRRKEAKPVMIDQIRKEAEQDKWRTEQEQLAARLAPRPKYPQGSMEKFQQEDGWNTVPGGRSTKQNVIKNPSKLKLTRLLQQIYDENVQLGPGGRPDSFGGWGKDSSGEGGQKSSSCSSESKEPQANRSQMLGEEKSSRSMSPSRDSNKSGSSSWYMRSLEREINKRKERRQAAIAMAQQLTGSPRSRSTEMTRNQEKKPAAPTISEEEYERRSKATIEEYLIVKDLEEVTAGIKELKSSTLQHIFIRVAIENVLEKKAHMRESIGRLFHRLLDASTISVEQFKIGLKEILEFADNMAIDIPLYWTYLGEIIGGMAAEGAKNFAFLKDSVQMVQGKSAKFMAEIMKAGVKYTNEQQMKSVWQASGFRWDMFLPQGSNVQEFLSDNNLTFTEKPVERASPIPPKEENRIGNFQRDLMLFQKENHDNNAVFDFIEESIPPELRKTKEFIRALVSAVCYGAVKGEGTNSRGDHELLKNRTVLMQRYIDGNPELELQAFYAVQHLTNSLENPPGLLRLFFDVLFDEDVIAEDTFYAWRDSQDPNEKNGKGIALKCVSSFYTWLEESDPPN